MIRYGDVITDEMRRMRDRPRSPAASRRAGVRHWGVLAKSAGALFIRSYERGERVHLAMVSRGYTGTMPVIDERERRPAPSGRAAAVLPLAGARRLSAGMDPVRTPLSGIDGSSGASGRRPRPSQVSGLAYAYPDGHQALFGVDLTVPRGERVALLGPNGAGKTTLVLHLNGILTAGAGSVTVAGLPVAPRNLAEIRRRVGIVFQDPDDQLFMPTVREDVAFGPATAGLRGAELDVAGARRARPGRHGGVRRPAAAPPLLRAAPPRRGGHRAGHAAGDPRARRAVLQPRPGLPPRTGRRSCARWTSRC